MRSFGCWNREEALSLKLENTSDSDIDSEEHYQELKMYCSNESMKNTTENDLVNVHPNTHMNCKDFSQNWFVAFNKGNN